MRTSIILMTLTGFISIIGCTSLNDFNSLPTPKINSVSLDLNNKRQPLVAIEYCIENNLPTEVYLASTEFKFYINNLLVDTSKDMLTDTSIPEQGRVCRQYHMRPNTAASTKAASTLYQRMLDRNYRLEAVLNFAEKEVASTNSSVTGVFKSSSQGVITGE